MLTLAIHLLARGDVSGYFAFAEEIGLKQGHQLNLMTFWSGVSVSSLCWENGSCTY